MVEIKNTNVENNESNDLLKNTKAELMNLNSEVFDNSENFDNKEFYVASIQINNICNNEENKNWFSKIFEEFLV